MTAKATDTRYSKHRAMILMLLGLTLGFFLHTCAPQGTQPQAQVVPPAATATPTSAPALFTLTPSPTASSPTAEPTAAATAISVITPALPEPTPTLWPVLQDSIVNSEYGIYFDAPTGWFDVTEHLPAPSGVLLQQAWSTDGNGGLIFTDPATAFADGLMVLTVTVSEESDAPFPPLGSTRMRNSWDQEMYVSEANGEEALPYAMRFRTFAARSPYRYQIELGCLPPVGDEGTCRNAWWFLGELGLCALPADLTLNADSWQVVESPYADYRFEVPSGWLREKGFPERGSEMFWGDPAVPGQPEQCGFPDGLIKLDFQYQPPGDGPDLTGFEPLSDTPYPTWMMKATDEDEFTTNLGRLMVIQGPEYWYQANLICIPPGETDEQSAVALGGACDRIADHWIETFEIPKSRPGLSAIPCAPTEVLEDSPVEVVFPFCVVWRDEFEDELGFRIELNYPNGEEHFSYEIGPDETFFRFPPFDAPRLEESAGMCQMRNSFVVEVIALRPELEWPVGSVATDVECASDD